MKLASFLDPVCSAKGSAVVECFGLWGRGMRRPRQLSTAASCELLHCWCTDNTDRQDSLKEKLLTARRSSYCTRCTGTPTPSSPTISVHVKTSASLPAFCSKSSFTGDRRRIRGPSPSRSVPSEVGKWLRPSDVCDKSFCMTARVLHTKSRRFPACPFRPYLSSMSCPRASECELSSRQRRETRALPSLLFAPRVVLLAPCSVLRAHWDVGVGQTGASRSSRVDSFKTLEDY